MELYSSLKVPTNAPKSVSVSVLAIVLVRIPV
jgi:hypothetical protein